MIFDELIRVIAREENIFNKEDFYILFAYFESKHNIPLTFQILDHNNLRPSFSFLTILI